MEGRGCFGRALRRVFGVLRVLEEIPEEADYSQQARQPAQSSERYPPCGKLVSQPRRQPGGQRRISNGGLNRDNRRRQRRDLDGAIVLATVQVNVIEME